MPSRKRHREAQRRATTTARPGDAPSGGNGSPASATGRTSATPTIGPRRITTPGEAAELTAHLLDPGRTHPVAVVSIPNGLTDPWIDASAITEAVKDLAEVVVLPTDASSWRFSELMPDMTQV